MSVPVFPSKLDIDAEIVLDSIKDLPRGDLLLPYQQRALQLLDSVSVLAIEKSRRIGMTWAFAAKAVLVAGAQREAGGKKVMYISYDKEMTREFIDACAMWAKAFDIAAENSHEFLFKDGRKGEEIQAFRIKFASGFEIVALSSSPRTIRGKQGLVILDEAAFVDDIAALLKAAMAVLMWGGKVVVLSTHDGEGNAFNQLLIDIRANRRKGAVLKTTLKDALADGLYERICLVTGEEPTPSGKIEWEADIRDSYGDDADEELDCIPSKGSGSWISPALIAAAAHEEAGHPRFYQGGLCFVGRDIARRNHLATILPFEDVNGVLWQRESVEMRNETFAAQAKEFDRIVADYRVVRAAFDQSGMGEVVVEQAQEKYGEHLVEGVIFSSTAKLNMATILKQRFEDGTIRIKNDDKTKADFRSIKKISGGTGAPRIAEDGSSDGHGDRFWAAALAVGAAGDRVVSFDHEASSEKRAGMEDLQIDTQTGFGVVGAGLDMSGWE